MDNLLDRKKSILYNIEDTTDKFTQQREEKTLDKAAFDEYLEAAEKVKSAISALDDEIGKFRDSLGGTINDEDLNKTLELAKRYEVLEKQINILEEAKKKTKDSTEKRNITKEINKLKLEQLTVDGTIDSLTGKRFNDIKAEVDCLKEKSKILESENKLYEEQCRVTTKSISIQSKSSAILKQNREIILSTVNSIANLPNTIISIFNSVKDLAKPWLEADHAVQQMVKTFGLQGKQLSEYRAHMFDVSISMSKWGKTMKDLVDTQQKYNEATGRNVALTEDAYDRQYQLNQIVGDEDGSALTSGMEIFGASVERSVDLYENLYKSALKMGISTQKATKEVIKNLKLAQKYNFAGGVKNMMEMSAWANKTRFNMDSLGSMIEKFDTLESTIQTSAQLQVLGGNFAMGADPLTMMYESMEDPDALAKRFNNMTKGMGRFNAETGETIFNGIDARRMKVMANASGQSVEDVRAQAMENSKRAYIQDNILSRNSGLTEEQIALVSSKAQANGDGTFSIVDNRGNKMNVADINNTNIERISADTEQEDFLSSIANESRSANDKLQAISSLWDSQKANAIEKALGKEWIYGVLNNIYDFLYKYDWLAGATLILGAVNSLTGIIRNFGGFFGNIGKLFKGNTKPSVNPSPLPSGHNSPQNPSSPSKGRNIFKNFKGTVGKALPKIGKIASKSIPLVSGAISGGIAAYNAYSKYKEQKNMLDIALENGEITQEQYDENVAIIKSNRNKGYGRSAIQGISTGLASAIPYVGIGTGILAEHLSGKAAGTLIKDKDMTYTPSQVIEMDDGVRSEKLIRADKSDNVLFAKDGGPYDTLFNDVFDKINEIYNVMSDNVDTKKNVNVSENDLYNKLNYIYNVNKNNALSNENNEINENSSNSNAFINSNIKNKDISFNELYNKLNSIYNTNHNNLNNDVLNNNINENIRRIDSIDNEEIKILTEPKTQDIEFIKRKYIDKYKSKDIIRNDDKKNIVSVQPVGFDSEKIIPYNNITTNDINKNNIPVNNNSQPLTLKPIDININGTINLNAGGNNVNIIDIVKNDPILIRQLSQMITKEISESINGGRTTRFISTRS